MHLKLNKINKYFNNKIAILIFIHKQKLIVRFEKKIFNNFKFKA